MHRFTYSVFAVSVLLAYGCRAQSNITLVEAFPTLTFARPVDLQYAPDGSNRLFVVEQAGVIRVFDNDASSSIADVFLDIRGKVNSNGNEEGLLGLAFHPDFKNNGYFYVNYTANPPRRTVVSRFSASASDPGVADPASETVLLTFDQPFSNHNGGKIAFGPDGYLYIGTGDGGSGGDPQKNGQSLKTLLGKILRIDVNRQDGGRQYAIPPDNPFAGNANGDKEEIWAYGLRNPWRFSFDPVTGRLWAGDVGQNKYEEIDIIEKGRNYGWNTMEGFHCYSPATGCDTTGLTLPIYEYGRTLGVSVTGGVVYRGSRIPSLTGKYLYADFGSGRLWSLAIDGSGAVTNEELAATGKNISAFGTDPNNNVYLCAFDGKIYTLSNGTSDAEGGVIVPRKLRLGGNYPNPASGWTEFEIEMPRASVAVLSVYDLLGRLRTRAFEGWSKAGAARVSVDLSELPAGLYVASLSAGESSDSRILAKR